VSGRRLSHAVELVKGTVRAAIEARTTGLAAEVAFFALLSMPPTLLAILGTVGYVAESIGPQATFQIEEQILGVASNFLTPQTVDAVGDVVTEFLSTGRADVIGIGLLIALWSASRATNAFTRAVAISYGSLKPRSAIKGRLLSFGITLLGVLGAVVVLPLVVAGPRLGEAIGRPLGLGEAFGTAWRVLYWPGVLLLGIAFLSVVYHLAGGVDTRWRRDVPGALLAAVLWLVGGVGLRVYALVGIERGETYGPLAAPVVLLLWIYVSSLALLLGAELNAQLEKQHPSRPGSGTTSDVT
jgi:membrane protein